jgi:hypothetical protein
MPPTIAFCDVAYFMFIGFIGLSQLAAKVFLTPLIRRIFNCDAVHFLGQRSQFLKFSLD